MNPGKTMPDSNATTRASGANARAASALPTNANAQPSMTAASARGMSNELRYRLMLENAHVHDTDGFLLDGENAHYNTFR